jgi:hypothetical protein
MTKTPQPELLIDLLFRETFKKKADPLYPELRKSLVRARRCVLADDMAAFLYAMMVELFIGPLKFKEQWDSESEKKRWHNRLWGRLDDCRYFSRLPHPVTWIEYRLAAMVAKEIEATAEHGYRSIDEVDERLVKYANTKIGWLLEQHPQIETAVSVQYFIGMQADGKTVIHRYPIAVTWCTDDTPLPWPSLQFTDEDNLLRSASAFVTGVRGYHRPNVGMRALHADASLEWAKPLQDRARMMWAFLSTFNKIPIIGEHQVVPARGFVARGSYRRFLDYKVLTINIPEQAGLRKIARQVIGIIRRRAHLVRGHWRDDWRLPKGNKSLWIHEHQRGDASVGFVTHDYEVHHDAA